MSVISVRHVSKAQARSISIYPFDKQELYIYIKKKKKRRPVLWVGYNFRGNTTQVGRQPFVSSMRLVM